MTSSCEICGTNRGLDRHHVIPRSKGGRRNPVIHDEANLTTLCRQCHRNIHEGRWVLQRSPQGIQLLDKRTGQQVMRRLSNPGMDVPSLFQLLNVTEESLSQLLKALPYFSDDQLVEAYTYATSFGKRSWLLQTAILYEAQQRSVYGERSLEAIARRFQIGLRQAQKYALVWKLFFNTKDDEENVNIDAFVLDEPSWYVVAATETKEPEKWLAYAQDRKMEDPRYSVATFRRDILLARWTEPAGDHREAREADIDLPRLSNGACPWVQLFCARSGKPIPRGDCTDCEFVNNDSCETNPTVRGEP